MEFSGFGLWTHRTLTAAVALLLSLVFLWPLGTSKAKTPLKAEPVETIEAVSESAPAAQTTAEAIAEFLAAEQQQRTELTLVNFAPLNLLPGQSLPTKSRRAGSSLGRYRSMANDLFKS